MSFGTLIRFSLVLFSCSALGESTWREFEVCDATRMEKIVGRPVPRVAVNMAMVKMTAPAKTRGCAILFLQGGLMVPVRQEFREAVR